MNKIFSDVWHIDDRSIEAKSALEFVTQAPNGAETLFVGTIRNLNHGNDVLAVSYDVFEPLAKSSFHNICVEAQCKWGESLDLYVVHAKGKLKVGDVSIIIAVGSPHRDEAFKACHYIIEQIKQRSPVWKLEHYQDGDSAWSRGCELCSHSLDKAEEANA